jgi:hypothetical protein
MIHFTCACCGSFLRVGESWAGLEMHCPECDGLIEVPDPDQPDHSSRRCPECDSHEVRRITTRREFKRKMADSVEQDDGDLNEAFTFRLPRECRACGAIWVPSLPKWSGLLLLIAGVLLLLFFLGLPIYLYFFAPPPRKMEYIYVSGALVAGSIGLIGYGYHVMRGGSGRPRILRAGNQDHP